MQGHDPFARGVRHLRRAAVLQLASAVLLIVAAALAIPSLILVLSALRLPRQGPPDPSALLQLLLPLAAPGLAALASLLLGAISVYAFLIPSASSLARWSFSFGASSRIIKLGYWGALLTGLTSAALLGVGFFRGRGLVTLAWFFGSIVFALVTLLLVVVGAVGVVTLLQGLYEATGLSSFKTAAVMIAVQIALSLLSLIPLISIITFLAAVALHIAAWYLVMDAAGRVLLPPPPP